MSVPKVKHKLSRVCLHLSDVRHPLGCKLWWPLVSLTNVSIKSVTSSPDLGSNMKALLVPATQQRVLFLGT
ncbi:hypothetical protein BpHYR1_000902 [Brachionus plicatilis]|uniref:Uncharacterized protein n=1 Tax=Brachionus plicatilis TaxID=10195 RepID=A0A3M7SF48_BRAPC|nr:hypothetical protein BpHYR1_000902 [Brachionus plicatilis]